LTNTNEVDITFGQPTPQKERINIANVLFLRQQRTFSKGPQMICHSSGVKHFQKLVVI
jgi:hypothetical protein